jgi:hypothetical protein
MRVPTLVEEIDLGANQALGFIPATVGFHAATTIRLYDPFRGTERNRNGFAVREPQTRSTGDGVAERIGSYWAAHRVG